ncbi:MAG: hypothetical protein ACXWKA_03305 [Xanthobacteraceae bacterium]
MERFVRTGAGIARSGFASTPRRRPGQRRARVLVQLIATAGLVLSLAVAATAVSLGIARAHTTIVGQ